MNRIFKAIVLLTMASGVSAQGIGGPPFIAVRGHAEVQVIPDIFPIKVRLSDKSLDTAKTQDTIEALAAEFLAKAKTFNLADADISIGNLAITPDYDYDEKQEKQIFLGNEYSRELVLRFHSLVDLKKFIAGVPARKEIKVSTLGFALSSLSETKRRLLASAIEDAKKTASVMAEGVGKRVLGAQTISDRPLSLSVGSYINPIDVSSVESTTILDEVQLDRLPVGRSVTAVTLLAPGSTRAAIVFNEGAITLSTDIYVIYLLGE